MAEDQQQEQQPTVRYITRKELEEHDEDSDKQWTLIDHLIVDITEYKHQHPGGDEILLEHAGADATESFNNVGHSKEARETLKTYIVGELHPDDRKPAKAVPTSSNASTDESSGSSGGLPSVVKFVVIPAVIFASAYFVQKFLQSSA